MRTTHTYAVLEVSPAAYEEIARLLREAGYHHVFHTGASGEVVIDMHGIALGREDLVPTPALLGPPIGPKEIALNDAEYKLLFGDGTWPRPAGPKLSIVPAEKDPASADG